MNKDVSYDFNIFIKKRKSLKLSIESVANELTLSIDQIKSLESNSQKGFATPHFQHLSLKKYAEFLDIDLDLDLDLDLDNENDSTITNNVDQSVSLFKRNRKKNKYILPIILLFFIIIYYLIVFFSNNLNDIEENTSTTINPDDSSIIENQINNEQSNDGPMTVNSLIKTPLPPIKPPLPTLNNELPDIEKSNSQIDFLCTVKSTATKKFSTRLPEKPSTYFHIISFDKQTICTIDADNNFREYEIEAGGKVTHRGKAPFNIQLNPNISELYFEGWKVHLQENDNFIQLKPSP